MDKEAKKVKRSKSLTWKTLPENVSNEVILKGKHLDLAAENSDLTGVLKKEGDIEIEDFDVDEEDKLFE